MPPRREIDCLIVGAGLAGLHCALSLKREHPYWRIVVAEKYGYIGGRVVTYHTKPTEGEEALKGLHWENGAGRIHDSHHLVGKYVRKYKLTKIPISTHTEFRHKDAPHPEPDRWPGLAKWIESFLRQLPRQQLASSTIRQLLEKTVGLAKTRALLQTFPYRSETETLRADAGLHSLRSEMGTYDNYYVIAEGLSALIDGMVEECKQGPSPVEFLLQHSLKTLEPAASPTTKPTAIFSTPQIKSVTIQSPRIILALHSTALSHIPPFTQWSLLKHVTMKPLLRIYAVFPVDSNKKCWFSNIPKTVTNSPIRYFIPINPSRGVAMISYTDGHDTSMWRKDTAATHSALLKSLRSIFPEVTIPDPLFLKFHEWTDGCSYWTPLIRPHIDQPTPFQLSRAALRPFPRQFPTVFVCGESFSTRQAWMEGALEHANLLVNTYRAHF